MCFDVLQSILSFSKFFSQNFHVLLIVCAFFILRTIVNISGLNILSIHHNFLSTQIYAPSLCYKLSSVWRGISSLYNVAQNRVLLAGDYGPLFYISRSVHQGCPLAPFLFLFFVEAMISFLNVVDIGIRRLYIPLSHIEVRDAEFANDTALYLKSDLENLQKTEVAISTFCKASSALVNWSKSFAFWVGVWWIHKHHGFTWAWTQDLVIYNQESNHYNSI